MYFEKSQGYEIKKEIFFQYNESTTKLLKNGKRPAGKQSKHISTRYFWMVDRIKKEELFVEYCPSGMITKKGLATNRFRYLSTVQ